jgi:hypothetical protein
MNIINEISALLSAKMDKYISAIAEKYSIEALELHDLWATIDTLKVSSKTSRQKGKISAYNLFCKAIHADLAKDNPGASFGDLAKLKSELWKATEEEEKNEYKAQADRANDKTVQRDTCVYIFTRGSNKGTKCTKPVKDGCNMCSAHVNIKIKTPVSPVKNGCKYIFTKGVKVGEECGSAAKEGTEFCNKHKDGNKIKIVPRLLTNLNIVQEAGETVEKEAGEAEEEAGEVGEEAGEKAEEEAEGETEAGEEVGAEVDAGETETEGETGETETAAEGCSYVFKKGSKKGMMCGAIKCAKH